MTIASLFVKLGFKIEGKEGFDKAVSQLGFGEVKALNLKHALLGAGTAMTALMYFAANAATGLYKFHLSTGLSTKSLQDWQFAGARANVAAGEVTSAIRGIQDAQAELFLGQGNAAPWALLGIDPRSDPFKVLWQIHERIKETGGLAPGIGRAITSQLGISDEMFQFLRRDNIELGQLAEKFKQTEAAQKRLDELNGRFSQMRYKIEQVGIELGDALGPTFYNLLKAAEPWIEKAANWLTKLASNTPDGERMRSEFTKMATGVFYAATAFTALSVAMKGVATVAAASTVIKALMGLGGAAAGTGTAAEAWAAAGGASVAGGGAAAAGGAAAGGGGALAATGIGALILAGLASGYEIGRQFNKPEYKDKSVRATVGGGIGDDFSKLDSWLSSKLGGNRMSFFFPSWMLKEPQPYTSKLFQPAGAPGGSTVSVSVTQHITGVSDPVAAGREAAKQIKQVLQGQTAAFSDQGAIGAAAH